MTVNVSLEEVKRVAELAHLELTAGETQGMLHDLNAILEYVAQLNELDTSSGVSPLAQAANWTGPVATGRFVWIRAALARTRGGDARSA